MSCRITCLVNGVTRWDCEKCRLVVIHEQVTVVKHGSIRTMLICEKCLKSIDNQPYNCYIDVSVESSYRYILTDINEAHLFIRWCGSGIKEHVLDHITLKKL